MPENKPNICCDGGMSSGDGDLHLYYGKHREIVLPTSPRDEIKPSSIIVNGVIGLVLLYLVNLLPFIHIPINILTVLLVFFTGILGVVILTIASVVWFIFFV